MKSFIPVLFNHCSHSDKKHFIIKLTGWYTLLFPLVGFLALIWIIIRILPKPGRLQYPCMKVAAPLASGFLVWTAGLAISGLALFKARHWFKKSERMIALMFTFIGIISLLLVFGHREPARASFTTVQHEANQPMGEAKGLFPGRVVWVYDPDATNENCNPSAYNHGWFLNENNDQPVIDQMLSKGIQQLTGSTTDSAAWAQIFLYFNQTHGRGSNGYQPGEKIFIKINATSSFSNYNSDLSKVFNSDYGVSETSPQLVFAVLKQLVNVVGVQEQDIYVGDPMRHIYKHCYDLWHGTFTGVHYLDHDGYTNLGREKVVKSTTAIVYYSDRGKVLRSGTDKVYSDNLYTVSEISTYMINIPMLKGHKRAGITAFPKNHFGTQARNDAGHLHNGLVSINEENPPVRGGYGLYRVQVDLMSSSYLEGKQLFFLLDALWGSDWEIHEPVKFMMAPFNNDWSSSIFLSQDAVAIESVGFDFLRSEFTVERGLETRPQMSGVDDYLHQAADSTNWPDSIQYDPENDGTVLASLGTHEHWNDAINKQYTRNLGTGNGIELVQMVPTTVAGREVTGLPDAFKLFANYPNPFNASTTIRYHIHELSDVSIDIYDIQGRKVAGLVNGQQTAGMYQITWNAADMATGIYFCSAQVQSEGRIQTQNLKMILAR